MKGNNRPWPATLVAVISVLLCAVPAVAAPAWKPCLECHGAPGMALTTAKGETLSLAVSAGELAGSAHRNLECRECHAAVQLDRHPSGLTVASLDAYRIEASKRCLGCHGADRLRALPVHAALVFEDQSLACTECHGAHTVRPIAAWKQGAGVNEYCLGCHSHDLRHALPGGATVSLSVDDQALKASVHPDHSCSDCHAGFTKTDHASGTAGGRRERSLSAARTCARCHPDKLKQIEGSIHYYLLRSGASGAPGCTDCHSAHAVAPKERYATLAGMPCRRCHTEIFEAYSASMHGKARLEGGHLDAPFCSGCHQAHDVQGSASAEKIRAACTGCHPTAAAAHAVWLPNAKLHLEAVSCASCHAPLAKRVVALRIVEEGSGRALGEREVAGLLGGDLTKSLDPAGNGIDGVELWSILRRLEQRRESSAAGLDFAGRLEVARGIDAHRLAGKTEAVRRCESCHQAGAEMLSRVAVKLIGDGGRQNRYEGAPGVLTSAASVFPVRHFYTLGSSRVVVLDWLLVLAFLAGCSVPVLHFTARRLAARSQKGR